MRGQPAQQAADQRSNSGIDAKVAPQVGQKLRVMLNINGDKNIEICCGCACRTCLKMNCIELAFTTFPSFE
jgi:hypothetical protein